MNTFSQSDSTTRVEAHLFSNNWLRHAPRVFQIPGTNQWAIDGRLGRYDSEELAKSAAKVASTTQGVQNTASSILAK